MEISNLTFEQFLNQKYAPKTVKSYLFFVEKFLKQHKNADNYDFSDIVYYLSDFKKYHSHYKNFHALFASIKTYYNYLVEIGIRDTHPCRMLIQKIKKPSIQIQDLFSSEELEILLTIPETCEILNKRNKIVISLFIYQGLLSSEIIDLKMSDIDFENNMIFVKGNRKVNKRNLLLNEKQLKWIAEYLENDRKLLNTNALNNLFLTIKGNKLGIDVLQFLVERYKYIFPDRKLNHITIRQSVISNLLNELHHSIEDVQLFIGHKWPSATERYKRSDIVTNLSKINKWHPLEK
jgi:integrase/recombinase XerD